MVEIITTCNVDFSMETKILIWTFIPITDSIIYHLQKAIKSFCDANVIESPVDPEGSQ